jgi:hypothetical protein
LARDSSPVGEKKLLDLRDEVRAGGLRFNE